MEKSPDSSCSLHNTREPINLKITLLVKVSPASVGYLCTCLWTFLFWLLPNSIQKVPRPSILLKKEKEKRKASKVHIINLRLQ